MFVNYGSTRGDIRQRRTGAGESSRPGLVLASATPPGQVLAYGCWYASKHTRWNVVDVGPKRDVMRLLVDAARKLDFKVGVSSHFAWNREFYPKWDPSFDTNDPAYQDLVD